MTELADRPINSVPAEDRPMEALAAALDQATARLAGLDPLPRQAAGELADALTDLHRAALVHIVRGLRADPRGKELLFELVDEPLVRMVLAIHGIIRPDPMTLARQALAGIRPQLQSHGGDVELVEISERTAFVRLSGACNGCSMSAVTMRDGVEQALIGAVPGITAVEVLPNEPSPTLIPLGQIGLRPGLADADWVKTVPIEQVGPGALTPLTVRPAAGEPIEVIVVNLDNRLSAYVNACAHLGLPLDDAELDPARGTLTCSWHGFCYDALSGECTSLPGVQLDQLPVRVADGQLWIRTGS